MPSEIILLFQTDVKSLWMPKNASIFLASFTNSWSVHNWKQFLNIIDQKLVKQPFISLLENTTKLKQSFSRSCLNIVSTYETRLAPLISRFKSQRQILIQITSSRVGPRGRGGKRKSTRIKKKPWFNNWKLKPLLWLDLDWFWNTEEHRSLSQVCLTVLKPMWIRQMKNYLKIHHGHVPLQWNFILAKIVH